VHARYSDIVPLDTTILDANMALLASANNIEHALGITEIGMYPIGATNLLDAPHVQRNRVQFSLLKDGDVIFTKELNSLKPFRLPAGFKSEIHAIQITASLPVFSMTIAESDARAGAGLAMKKPAIPVVRTGNPEVDNFAAAVKQSLDTQTGQAKNAKPLPTLGTTATLADVIAAYNQLLQRVQGA
jgi:hypothetical protein